MISETMVAQMDLYFGASLQPEFYKLHQDCFNL